MKLLLKIIPVLLFLSLFTGCRSQWNEYQKMEFKYFEITVPQAWKAIQLRGIDSYVGAIQLNHHEKVTFDYGQYSNPLTDLEKGNIVLYEKINGLNAKIIHSENQNSNHNTVGIYFEQIRGKIKFEMNGKNISKKNQQELLKVFRTLKFK